MGHGHGAEDGDYGGRYGDVTPCCSCCDRGGTHVGGEGIGSIQLVPQVSH
jgi:hypothetical protein